MSNFILSKLDWSTAKKDWCAGNVSKAFGCKPLGNAYEFMKYVDSQKPTVWSVAVFNKGNHALTSNPQGLEWGHVGVVTDIYTDGTCQVFDGPAAYNFKVKINSIDGFITPQKMIALGATRITEEDIKATQSADKSFYENIFKEQFPNGSTIFKNLDLAKEKFGDIAFFIAIGLERVKQK